MTPPRERISGSPVMPHPSRSQVSSGQRQQQRPAEQAAAGKFAHCREPGQRHPQHADAYAHPQHEPQRIADQFGQDEFGQVGEDVALDLGERRKGDYDRHQHQPGDHQGEQHPAAGAGPNKNARSGRFWRHGKNGIRQNESLYL
jgi:hypothetical protein